MGKSLVIKGADFSENGIREDVSVNITSLFASHFVPQQALSKFQNQNGSANTKRCCVPAVTFATLGVDITQYSTIVVTYKNGFDYVLGTGPVPGTATNWQGWNGTSGGQAFGWVTTNQQATITIDSTVLAISMNIRYDDDTTTFESTAVITDMVDSIILYP